MPLKLAIVSRRGVGISHLICTLLGAVASHRYSCTVPKAFFEGAVANSSAGEKMEPRSSCDQKCNHIPLPSVNGTLSDSASIAYGKRWEQVTLDTEAVDMLASLENKVVFHFGSGNLHFLGLQNMDIVESKRHHIYAITGSIGEFTSYELLVSQQPELARFYHCHYTDAFLLSALLLPKFDIVNMFHVGEYSYGDASKERHLLLQLVSLRQQPTSVIKACICRLKR